MIPTAEEFFRNKIKEEIEWEGKITLSKVPLNAKQAMIWAQEYSIMKAEFHVTEALKQVSEKNLIIRVSCGDSNTCGCMGSCEHPISYINKKSIINAYPLTNIK